MTMKRYPNCVHKLFYEPLLITPSRHAALCKVLEARMAGQMPDMPMDDDDEMDDMMDGMLDMRGDSAIIPIKGVITAHASDIPASSCGCGLDIVSQKIKAARASSEVRIIVFDMCTPGGGVPQLPETARLISSITDKRTVAYADTECCSAGVWLASQCNYFYCAQSASVGSIGVWCAYLDASRMMQNEGLNMQAISAGKFKLLGAYWKPLTPEETGMLQADVDKIYSQFKEAVNLNREIADDYMQGQIFDGEQACEVGLCDGMFDSLDDLMDSMKEDDGMMDDDMMG